MTEPPSECDEQETCLLERSCPWYRDCLLVEGDDERDRN